MPTTWFAKSVLATVTIVPTFIAIPFFKKNFGVDPLIFVVWYFGGTSLSIAVLFAATGRGGALVPAPGVIAAILAIGVVIGALANGSLFQAVGLAPNPGLPPVIYATASLLVYALSILLASRLPALFDPVSAQVSHVAGIALVLGGLWLIAAGRGGA